MSLPRPRYPLARAASLLACGPALAVLCACYPGSSVMHQPVSAARVERGERSADDPRLPSFPGVAMVSTNHGGFSIRILSGLVSGEPLYVIDGAPMLLDPYRGIDWFKPEDIVRLSVLKDPSQTSIYGPRGANGVIVLTTKQGAPRKRQP
jgi:TonB-dependent SusC/RagA subfamily outer membrane receptor